MSDIASVEIGQYIPPTRCSSIIKKGIRALITSCTLIPPVAALFLGSPAFGQGADTELASPFVLPRDLVDQRDANPFRFAGEVVTPSARSWPRYENALERHPTTESCLTEDARGGPSLDLLAYDWMGINGRYAHDVCLFRVWTALESPELVVAWMEEFDMTVSRINGPEYIERFGHLFTGSWSWDQTTEKSSLGGWGLQRLLDDAFFEPTVGFTANFLPDGGLDYAAVSYIRK